MVTTSIILYILGMLFCVLFASRTLDGLNELAGDVALIKHDMELFMATAADLQTIAISLLDVANQVKTIVDDLKANSVNPKDLDSVAATLNDSVTVLNSIVNP